MRASSAVPPWGRDALRGVLAGVVLGAAEGLAAATTGQASGGGAALSVLLAALFTALAGVLVGLLLGPLERVALRLLGSQLPSPAPRWPALGLLAAGWLLTLGLIGRVFADRLMSLQDSELVVAFIALALLIAGLMSPLLLGLLTPPLAHGLAPALRRWPAATRPSSAWAPPLLVVTAALLWLLLRHGPMLGALIQPLELSLLILLFGLLSLLPPPPPQTTTRRARLLLYLLPPTLFAATLGAGFLLSGGPSGRACLTGTFLPVRLASTLERLTDVDGDGHGALFGGRDCAPFDATRHPAASDLPENGIDEDCDGRDRARSRNTRPAAPRRHRPEASKVRDYNLVLIIVDAFRADRLGARHKKQHLTPALDRFADEALAFSRAYSQAPSTAISLPSLLSGLSPLHLRWTFKLGVPQAHSDGPSLTRRLRQHGYLTHVVTNNWVKRKMGGMVADFHGAGAIWMGQDYRIARRGSAPSSTTRAIEFLERAQGKRPRPAASKKAGRRFFLKVYYEDPHAPYEDHKERGLAAGGKGAWARYNNEIRYVDHHLGFLLDYLRSKPGLWHDTIVVVTSDHGEEFQEHGGFFHDRTCYVESVHVPLLVRVPGFEARRIERQVSLIDIAPTLLDLLGLKSDTPLDGQSLLATAEDPSAPERPSYCAHFASAQPAHLTRSVRSEGFTLVDGPRGRRQLFEHRQDPKEKQDLAQHASHRSIEAQLRALLGAGGERVR